MTTRYSQEFRDQAIAKTLQRGDKTIKCIAKELNVNIYTLKHWLRNTKITMTDNTKTKRPSDWTRAQRFQALMESACLEGEALNAFCRKQGIFSHHLANWKIEFIKATEKSTSSVKTAVDKAMREENKQLKKELNRKEKALAETAALLVLQKKCQAFWEGEV